MSVLDARIDELSCFPGGDAKERIVSEFGYARRVSLVNEGRYDELIEKALSEALKTAKTDGAITAGLCRAAEKALEPMAEACKKYRFIMVGHAHIDMNWMWRYDETVSITLDTFRTMLNLMKDYPRFTFAQSQASTYSIVEQFEPAMLNEIREKIKAGQWEVAASTWVEADRNMPSAESVARHFLYTKRYLPKLLGIDSASLNLDYEPDTFGHNKSVPELLNQAGIKYYYHCRGEEGQTLYRWKGETGSEILVYLEPDWYLGPVTGANALIVPEFCAKFGTDTAINVYGVGDHGGGPTRRDIEKIIEMGSWPIFPVVDFGTYKEFYEAAERCREKIPVLEGERNIVFSGCYTTQTRIKRGNRTGEKKLFDAESIGAFAKLNFGAPYDREGFEKAWRRVLFNQFHDIIPGSGVIDTREYAMGNYQEAYAAAESAKRLSRGAIESAVNTASLVSTDLSGTTSEGAGVGFGVEELKSAQMSVGGGTGRAFILYNSLPRPREEVVELILWDYSGDTERVEAVDANGKNLKIQWLDRNFNEYWQHHWAKLVVKAEIPALGYTTIALRLREEKEVYHPVRRDPRVERPFEMALENDVISAKFDPATGRLISLADRATGKTRVSNASFVFVKEDPSRGMTSWVVGRTVEKKYVTGAWKIKEVADGPLYKAYRMETTLGERSKLTCVVSLAAGSDTIDYDVSCDWQEIGDMPGFIPQLAFEAELSGKPESFVYDVPGGLIERKSATLDQPSQGLVCASGVKLMCDSRYGMRGQDDVMSVTLIRSAFDPDPYPEQGVHVFRIGLGVTEACTNALLDEAAEWNRPVEAVSARVHEGKAALAESFMEAEGCVVTGVKLAEDDDGLIVRVTSAEGGEAKLEFSKSPKKVVFVDTLEQEQPGEVALDGRALKAAIPAGATRAIKVVF